MNSRESQTLTMYMKELIRRETANSSKTSSNKTKYRSCFVPLASSPTETCSIKITSPSVAISWKTKSILLLCELALKYCRFLEITVVGIYPVFLFKFLAHRSLIIANVSF